MTALSDAILRRPELLLVAPRLSSLARGQLSRWLT